MDAEVFRQSFGLLPEPVILLSWPGGILASNRALRELLGYERGIGLPAARLQDIVVDPEEKVERFLQLCRRSRELFPFALTCRTAAGGELACRVEGALLTTPMDASSGALLVRVFPKQAMQSKFLVLNDRIAALHREIVERQQAQARLYAEREWLRTTLASIGDAVIATGADGRIVFLNAVAESVTGWSQAEAAGLPVEAVFQIVNEETRRKVESPVGAVLQRGTLVGLANHTLLIAKDGVERPIADSAAPIRDESGRMIGVVLVFRDVTEAHRAQNLVIQSEKRFRRIFETASVGIWEQDLSLLKPELLALPRKDAAALRSYFSEHPEFLQRAARSVCTVDVNAAAVQLFEAADKQELLVWLPDLLARNNHALLVDELLAVAQGKATFQSEASLVTLRGRRLQVVFTLSFPPPDPELSSVLVTFMDITGRKLGEEALQRANDALQRANADLEQFAYAAAHDLQEPLRNVVLYTQILQRSYGPVLDRKGLEACQITVEGARRMQALVQGLLDYTRVVPELEAQTDRTLAPALDCARILAAVKENLRAAIEESHARILYDDLPAVHARDTHLLQIFQNLLGNAIKYRKPGQEAVIRIMAREREGHWVFLVEDNGLGIRPEYQRKIFEAFKRLHGSEIPGAGMGLAICSRIVAHYGGRMWVEESEEGRGSTFAFSLPQRNR